MRITYPSAPLFLFLFKPPSPLYHLPQCEKKKAITPIHTMFGMMTNSSGKNGFGDLGGTPFGAGAPPMPSGLFASGQPATGGFGFESSSTPAPSGSGAAVFDGCFSGQSSTNNGSSTASLATPSPFGRPSAACAGFMMGQSSGKQNFNAFGAKEESASAQKSSPPVCTFPPESNEAKQGKEEWSTALDDAGWV